MKNCPDKEMLSRYLDGEISPRERYSVENHLKECEECRSHLAELREVEVPLKKIYLQEKPLRKRKAGCISEERIIAYLEDHLPEEARQKVAAHLSSCRFCSQVAAEARAALKTIEALRRRGLNKTPGMLTQRAAARFIPPKQSYLGSIIVELKELLLPSDRETAHQRYSERGTGRSFSAPAPERLMAPRPIYGAAGGNLAADEVMELHIKEPSRMDFQYTPESSPAQRAGVMPLEPVESVKIDPVIEYTYKKPWMNLVVSFTAVTDGEARCIITLKDGDGMPAPDVSVHVGEDSTKPFFRRTDENGVIELVVFARGDYKLRIDYMRGMILDMKIK